eukprot:762877-Hanusia_phi.AAC.2
MQVYIAFVVHCFNALNAMISSQDQGRLRLASFMVQSAHGEGEARIEAREEALGFSFRMDLNFVLSIVTAKKKAERAAKRAAKVKLQQPEAKQEDDFWGDLLKESK